MSSNENHALEQAQLQFHSIKEMMEAVENAETEQQREEAIQRIDEGPLSIEIRSGWCVLGDKPHAEEYKILLCTGGPAVQIIGDLNRWNEPHTAKIQYQDWFTPWRDLALTDEQENIVLEYARHFYFGEA